jgi:hypothetical protein
MPRTVCLLTCLGFAACSPAPDCAPEIEKGTTFKVTVLSETANSQKCHVIDVPQLSPFQISAAKTEPTATHPDCSVTPAAAPPVQHDVILDACIPGTSDMLSIFCRVKYEASCMGYISFWFAPPKDQIIDWKASTIDNVLFQVKDDSPGCLDNINNCFDQYLVRLDRLN